MQRTHWDKMQPGLIALVVAALFIPFFYAVLAAGVAEAIGAITGQVTGSFPWSDPGVLVEVQSLYFAGVFPPVLALRRGATGWKWARLAAAPITRLINQEVQHGKPYGRRADAGEAELGLLAGVHGRELQ